MRIAVTVDDGRTQRAAEFAIARMYNLGSATRKAETAVAHQEEVAKEGIRIALDVPAPRIYPIATHSLTTGTEVEAQCTHSSGEIEIVLLLAEQLYVGVGSDHTDRALEKTSIPWSKQVTPNVLAPVLWPFEAMRARWDDCVMRSWVDGRLYQDVPVAAFLHPDDVLRIVRERVPGMPKRDVMIFCGTIVSLDKALGFGKRWEIEMEDPGAKRRIRHGYDVVNLFDAVDSKFRVPIAAADRSIR